MHRGHECYMQAMVYYIRSDTISMTTLLSTTGYTLLNNVSSSIINCSIHNNKTITWIVMDSKL